MPEKPQRKSTRDAEGSILKRVEERRTANGKTRKETVYYARVRQNEYDENGRLVKTHELKRRADSYNDALIKRRQIRLELQDKIAQGKKEKDLSRTYFFDLLDFFEKHYVKPAVYSGKKKIAGQRNPVQNTKRMIASFREFFGNVPVASIDYARVFTYKFVLLETEYKVRRRINKKSRQPIEEREYVDEWRKRKPATVHRYLSCLRRALSIGVQQGFASSNPFKDGDPLIETAIEETRVRICTYQEEQQLYSVCVPPFREHLKNVITVSIDTFPRENELFSLIGDDVDLENRFLVIQETNAKTLKERSVPLTDRAYAALQEIRATKTAEEWRSQPVFGLNSVYKAWYTALRLTEIKDLRFHDLRGTGITRMLDAGVPVPVVMKFSGHEKYETFMKYVKKDLGIIQNAGAAMSELTKTRIAEISKGQNPLSQVPNEPSGEIAEVTELGDTVN
jgi:integrase